MSSNNLGIKKTIKADAEFLERAIDEQLDVNTENAYTSLHRSNLLKIQTDQLIRECSISGNHKNISEAIGSSSDLLSSVKWYTVAEQYTNAIHTILHTIPPITLKTNIDQNNNINNNNHSPFPLFGDRPVQVTINKTKDTTIGLYNNNYYHPSNTTSATTSTTTSYNQMSSVSILHQLGYTKATSGNAHVMPIIERTIILPNTLFTSDDNKDYLRHRYTDKRNAIVWYVAQYLSRPEFQSVTGKVYWRYWQHDERKPVLLLIPPTLQDNNNNDDDENSNNNAGNKSNNEQKKKKKKNSSDTESQRRHKNNAILKKIPVVPKLKKVKFHLLLHFGIESIEWIPRVRLLPNRCNIIRATINDDTNNNKKQQQISCYYNNQILLEDAKHLWYETAAGKIMSLPSTKTNDKDNIHSHHHHDIDYDESWYRNWNATTILIKIWALQRGLFRGHDTLTTDIIIFQLLYLFRTKQANAIRMTPIQIFTIWLKFITETNWLGTKDSNNKDQTNSNKQKNRKSNRDVLVLPLPGKNEKQTIATSQLAKLYAEHAKHSPVSIDGNDPPTLIELYQNTDAEYTGPVFLDPSMTYNYTGRLSPSYTILLQRETQKSLDCVHSHSPTLSTSSKNGGSGKSVLLQQSPVIQNPFAFLFMTEARFWKRHDMYVRLKIDQIKLPYGSNNEKKDVSQTKGGHNQQGDGHNKHTSTSAVAGMGAYESIARTLVQVLQRALGDRVRTICPLTNGNGSAKQHYHDRFENENANKQNKSVSPVLFDSDEIPTYPIVERFENYPKLISSVRDPTGSQYITLGINLNPDTCFRVVDRGPPVDHADEVKEFLDLWGRQKAELRRFKDGAIVHAVVWDSIPAPSNTSNNDDQDNYVQFHNDDKWQGGIVERIIQHMVKLHFMKYPSQERMAKNSVPKKGTQFGPQFSLRNINSIIDGAAVGQSAVKDQEQAMKNMVLSNPLAAHRMVMKAFDQLATFLRKYSTPTIPVPGSPDEMKSALQVPLAIDAVEPLSPALRYAELYPPVPHPMLGSSSTLGMKKVSGAVQSDPIEIQIRLGHSSKWPTDLKAIGAAKTAMLIALVNGIESMKNDTTVDMDFFDGPVVVTSSYADIGFMGYVFRISVRADPELKLLRSLRQPSNEATALLRVLSRKTIFAATHHTIVHAVYTKHPSSSATVRMVRRWIASHLLSDHIPFEALELLIVHIYTNRSSPLEPPGTVTVGFQRFLHLFSCHDWQREPLIVDPQGYFSDDDQDAIRAKFEQMRGSTYQRGPPMYIISPCNRASKDSDSDQEASGNLSDSELWIPVFTSSRPEQVVLSRAVALAERTYSFLSQCQRDFSSNSWYAAFKESASSFRSYSALLRVDPSFVVDTNASSDASSLEIEMNSDGQMESSYTRSMLRRIEGPKELRRKLYRNLMGQNDSNILLEWQPVPAVVQTLRSKLGRLALFFYNDLCPDVIAVVWRRPLFQPKAFSALNSEYVQPVTAENWKPDTLVTLNVGDTLREIVHFTSDIVIDIKVFDSGAAIQGPVSRKRKNIEANTKDHSSSQSSSDSSDSESD